VRTWVMTCDWGIVANSNDHAVPEHDRTHRHLTRRRCERRLRQCQVHGLFVCHGTNCHSRAMGNTK
jgi:hypothetical protein